MKFSIPEMNMAGLEKKLARISRKAEKYGCDFHFTKLGEHFETRELKGYDEDGKAIKEVVKFIDIDVEGKAEVNGWRFAASLEYTDKGNLIAGVEGLEIPERYYTCSPWCEHCKTRRDRKSSYIVYHAESGEFKQVGKSCLRDFTGGLSAEAVAQYESWIKEAEEASEFTGMGGWCEPYYRKKDFMAAAAETIRIYGYVKRDFDGICTADLTQILYRVENGMRLTYDRKYALELYAAAKEKGWDMNRPESIAEAETVIDWVQNNERDDNYYHNLKVACSLEYLGGATMGLVVSAFAAHNRDLEFQAAQREKARKAEEEIAASDYVGTIGDRVSFKATECKCLTSWETQFGTTYVYKFRDTDGNVYTWKTSKWLGEEDLTVTGTVKDHKEYRGVKQTELTRCKIA